LLVLPLILVSLEAKAGGVALPALIHDVGAGILLAGFLAIVFTRLKIPNIAAFLASGVLVGPYGLALVTDPANIDTIAYLGLVMLLFLIGLELDFNKLRASSKTLILTGVFQVPLSILVGCDIANLLMASGLLPGVFAGSSYVPLYIGLFLASSSTLLVA